MIAPAPLPSAEFLQPGDEPQVMRGLFAGEIRTRHLPPPDADVLPGVPWGRFDALFTPAFWAGRVWLQADTNTTETFRLGSTLTEEVVACLLGGHGLPAAVGLAAFHQVRAAGLCVGRPSASEVEVVLRQPLLVRGRPVHYRFPRQRASFIAGSLARLSSVPLPTCDVELRALLETLPGIGPKTASWITRNWMESDRVAIIDIHIQRAGVLAGIFPASWTPARHYRRLEERFLAFADAIQARACLLDNLMWQEMRHLARFAGRVQVAA
jgi:thermostable 8-oxoguanine DNA glycosylase